jgi:hypothetical protein
MTTDNTPTPRRASGTVPALVRWAVLENVFTLIVFAAVVIFAPGAWKWAGVACLLNINYLEKRETPNAQEHRT